MGALNRMYAGAMTYYESDHLGPQAEAMPKRFPGQATANWTRMANHGRTYSHVSAR
jgi:hypothetical protein